MPESRRSPVTDPVIDDYPVRPPGSRINEKANKPKEDNRILVVFSLVYFLYGLGISIYGPLYPIQAAKNGLNPAGYGSVLAVSHLMCILSYPLACRFVTSVSYRNSLSVGIFVIGTCRILFGTVFLIPETSTFTAISFAIQITEGFGMSILVACTILTVCSRTRTQIPKFSLTIIISVSLGLVLGPPIGEVTNEKFRFDFPFYMIGGLTALSFILIVTLLPEQDQQVSYKDMPVINWIKDKIMIIYFYISFVTFNYAGFLSVSAVLFLKQFHLNKLYAGFMFSISPFVFGLTFPAWAWLIKKGCNSVMLIFIGSIMILVSLVLLGPATFLSLEGSLAYVCSALVLEGLGVACKSACVVDASEKDLRYQKKHSETEQNFIVYTIFILGAISGYFSGSFTAGLMDYYTGYRSATIPLLILELSIAVLAVIYAMNRNYVSRRRREMVGEQDPILRS